MKNVSKMILAAAIILCGSASAVAAAEADPEPIVGNIEDGSYVIRIPVAEDDLGWGADEMGQEGSAVRLGSEEIKDGYYIVRYDPVADGTSTVALRHFDTVVCDEMHTYDLKVENGKVTEVTGGSYTASPNEEDQDPYISGGWVEVENQLDVMNIEKNEEKGWNVEIVSMDGGDVYIFRGTVSYDCERDEFIYADGEFYLPGDGAAVNGADLGDPVITGASGAIRMEGEDENNYQLGWYNWYEGQSPEPVLFERAIPEGAVMPNPYEVDVNHLEDGIYPVDFDIANLMNVGSGLTLVDAEIFTEDTYDIVDISTLEVGSYIYVDGKYIEVKTLDRGDFVTINEGESDRTLLRAFEEDNCFKVVQEDDYPTYTSHGLATLVLNDECEFTDASKLDAEPVVAEGINAIMEMVEKLEMDEFCKYNTKIRVENGEIVEIVRNYMP